MSAHAYACPEQDRGAHACVSGAGGTAPWTRGPVLGPAPRMDLAAARRYCAAVATGHYENFPVFLGLFSRTQQDALAAVYAFARTADDFADEPVFAGRREALLDAWEDALRRCFAGEASHPVFVALRASAHELALEPQPFLELLSAFRQDARVGRYETFDDVLDYCRRSADPVGRLVLRILGIDDPQRRAWSDRICTALQLTNFWQDLSVDIPHDRLYLPLEDLDRFGVPLRDVLARRPTRAVESLLHLQVERTKEMFREGRPLVTRAGWPAGPYLAAVWLGGRTVLAMTSAAGTRVLHERPALGPRTGAAWAWALARRTLGAGT
ncbi:MAG: squalene synthase HpnC [Deltaproteobacteria bacterium]|nr:squalene synthase HpnC [Deltaproteobacteria bacterium]